MPPAGKKQSDDTYYAWTDIYNGGEVEVRKAANGSERKIVGKRNITERGSKVTQSGIGATDAEWENLVIGGSVRNIPVPEASDEFTSPHRAVLATIVDENGDIDVNKLLAMGAPSVGALTTLPPPTNPSAEEGKTLGEDGPSGA
jgi:transcriptional regulator of nitric oxide reductase